MTTSARHEQQPEKVFDTPVTRKAQVRLYDKVCFGLGTIGALWLAVLLAVTTPRLSWSAIVPIILLWAVLAYLVLPRLNRMMAAIYVPDYFIGRTRTSDGLLGDPLNLAVRGTGEQLATALDRARWIEADPVTLASSVNIVRSTLTKRSYPTAPVSPLFLFDRMQDAAWQQEVEGNPAQRHHVRFWRTPEGWPLPGGARVDWLAGGTYDRRVGLSLFTLQITHKIDANIDIERDFIIDSVTTAVPEATVDVLRDFTASYHSRNGGGDSVHTDGDLPVLDVTAVTPAPQASDLRPEPSRAIPLQVWLPVIVSLVVTPVVVWLTLRSWPTPEGDRALAVVTLVGSVVIALMALWTLARRAMARRVLLAVGVVVALTHIASLTITNATDLETSHTLGAMTAILIVVALSSPKATDWTNR